MDRVVRVEAVDSTGQLLGEAEFRWFVNGDFFGEAKNGKGFATLQIEGDAAKIVAEVTFRDETKRVAFALNADRLTVPFDPDRRPPRPPPILHKDDPQKQRWGGLAEAGGRRLGARLIETRRADFLFDLWVESRDGTPLAAPVRFHLHDSYAKSVQDIRKLDPTRTRATFAEIDGSQAFCVGAQVRSAEGRWIGLEYDLNTLPGLPQRLKSRRWVAQDRANRKGGVAATVPASPPPLSPQKRLGPTAGSKDERLALSSRPKPMTPWFADTPLAWTRSETRGVAALLMSAYSTNAEALTLAKDAGLDVTVLDQGAPVKILMRQIMEWARRSDRLLQLLVEALGDAGQEAIHAPLWQWLAGYEGAVVAAAMRRKPSLSTLAMLPPSIEVWAAEGAAAQPAGPGFEKIINAAAGFSDPAVFRRHLAEAEVRTARIEIGGKPKGTGFLVGDRLLLTNWHVVAGLTKGGVAVFDSKVSAFGGRELDPGRKVPFEADWLVASSEYSGPALEIGQDGPPPGSWDFALVRLAEPVGAQAIGPDPKADGDKRGRYILDGSDYAFEADEPVFVLGHPGGRPVQFSYASPSQAVLTKMHNRVRYQTNTEAGSSGSPVFNRDWRIVALHHAAGPTETPGVLNLRTNGFNQGIPISGIVAQLLEQLAGKPELTELGLA